MNARERAVLAGYISRGDRVLEVGTADGVTCAWLADKCPKADFLSVDTFPGKADGVTGALGDKERWAKNKRQNMELYVGTVAQCIKDHPKVRCEVAIVDGEHTYKACAADIAAVLRVLTAAGVLACHDYAHRKNGVKQAVDEAVAAGKLKLLEVAGSMAFLEAVV